MHTSIRRRFTVHLVGLSTALGIWVAWIDYLDVPIGTLRVAALLMVWAVAQSAIAYFCWRRLIYFVSPTCGHQAESLGLSYYALQIVRYCMAALHVGCYLGAIALFAISIH